MKTKYKFSGRFMSALGIAMYEWTKRVGNDDLFYYEVCYRNVDDFWRKS